jgi:hypothetical protein
MPLGEGLAARRAEFGLDRVSKADVIGFPQHAFDLAVTIVRGERSGRVAKCIAGIRVGAIGTQRYAARIRDVQLTMSPALPSA